MTTITPELTAGLQQHFKDKTKIGSYEPYPVATFGELIQQTARLSYLNKDHLLFYRGQSFDHLNKYGSSTFYPSIYRQDYLTQREVIYQFDILENACELLIDMFQEKILKGVQMLKKESQFNGASFNTMRSAILHL